MSLPSLPKSAAPREVSLPHVMKSRLPDCAVQFLIFAPLGVLDALESSPRIPSSSSATATR
jgi:branched-subunit amino acid transport protein